MAFALSASAVPVRRFAPASPRGTRPTRASRARASATPARRVPRVAVPRPAAGANHATRTRVQTAAADDYAGPLDVVALGNMCVDVLLPPAPIPSPETLKTADALASFADADPPESSWEVGGNCNFLIAAARIGLRAECVGHVGDDKYGDFIKRVLADEGVPFRRLASEEFVRAAGEDMSKTLLCFVLTDGDGGHAFCSRYDLGPWPLLADVRGVDDAAARSLGRARAVFVNGFVFDEMRPDAVGSAVAIAKANGAGVFFDPGPRAFTFVRDPERREALDTILGAADVVLATLEEAAALVDADAGARGHDAVGADAVGGGVAEASLEPAAVAARLLARPGCAAQWVVIKCGPDGASIFTRRGDQVYVGAPRVEVGDTVGCGDSAAAAIVLGYAKIAAARKKLFDASSGKIAYLPNAVLAALMEETLTLATAVGAATATRAGAGRNVARVEDVEKLLEGCAAGGEECVGFGINPDAAKRARGMLDESLKKSGRR